MDHQRFIVQGKIPGSDAERGQVIEVGNGARSKYLALHLIKPLPSGSSLSACHCGAQFTAEADLLSHKDARHPAPTPPKAAPVAPQAVKAPAPIETPPAPPAPEPKAEAPADEK